MLKYPEVTKNDLVAKLKTHMYTACLARAEVGDDNVKELCKDLQNAADHWTGDHSVCQELGPDRKCVTEKWGLDRTYYAPGGSTHLAIKAFLQKRCTPAKMRFYTRARQNYLSETFNSVINKFASKRIHYSKSHVARVGAACLDWNETMDRNVKEKKQLRVAASTAVRTRGSNRNILSAKTYKWKNKIKMIVFA